MLVRFLCPACHQLLGIAPRKVGAQVNCPKCGATILVPDPEEPHPAETSELPASADVIPTDFPIGDIPTSDEPPADAVGSDVLGDAYDRLTVSVSPSLSAPKRAPHPDLPIDDGERIVISRRVLYFQAALLAVVGVLALLAGYLIGSGARLHGP